MAKWIERASKLHKMDSHDLEVMGLNPGHSYLRCIVDLS